MLVVFRYLFSLIFLRVSPFICAMHSHTLHHYECVNALNALKIAARKISNEHMRWVFLCNFLCKTNWIIWCALWNCLQQKFGKVINWKLWIIIYSCNKLLSYNKFVVSFLKLLWIYKNEEKKTIFILILILHIKMAQEDPKLKKWLFYINKRVR